MALLQGNKKGTASAIAAPTTSPMAEVNYLLQIVWEECPGLEDLDSQSFVEIKDSFGKEAGDVNGVVENVSISMEGKSNDEKKEAAEKEVLDELGKAFLFLVLGFVDYNEN